MVASAKAGVRRIVNPRRFARYRLFQKARNLRASGQPVRAHLRYLLTDPELDNFTYELDNTDELQRWLDELFGHPASEYVGELANDHELQSRLEAATKHVQWSKTSPPFGRRAAWYAIARQLKPRRVLETGMHDGLGSLVLLRALERNAEDGASGRLVSFDINRHAGWIVGRHALWERIIAPAEGALPDAARSGVSMFIHDSLHTYEHERFELETAAKYLEDGGVLISDNAHATTALRDVCGEHQMQYSYFQERPRGHFYLGGGVGVAIDNGDPRDPAGP